jgi:catechol 2,3-dioxygenase-like lactoylglutathione lyase family enzyme
MLHHISLGVVDLVRSTDFYDAVFAPLGIVRVWSDIRPNELNQAVGYGVAGGGDKLALKQVDAVFPSSGFHVAFAAPNRQAVDDFYAAALANGGQCNGAAGLRPHYGEHYYAAFVIDPDGHHIEAVINSAPN